MSLYCFGKLMCKHEQREQVKRSLQDLTVELGVRLDFSGLDPCDLETVEELSSRLRGCGVVINLYSSRHETSATGLWLESMAHARKCVAVKDSLLPSYTKISYVETVPLPSDYETKLASTRFGRICSELINNPYSGAGGLALVDGEIERIIKGSREECLSSILRFFLLPWDCGPNALYIWGDAADGE